MDQNDLVVAAEMQKKLEGKIKGTRASDGRLDFFFLQRHDEPLEGRTVGRTYRWTHGRTYRWMA